MKLLISGISVPRASAPSVPSKTASDFQAGKLNKLGNFMNFFLNAFRCDVEYSGENCEKPEASLPDTFLENFEKKITSSSVVSKVILSSHLFTRGGVSGFWWSDKTNLDILIIIYFII